VCMGRTAGGSPRESAQMLGAQCCHVRHFGH
jgi:hypothetical protein